MHAFPKDRLCLPCCLVIIIEKVDAHSLHPKQNATPTKVVLLHNSRKPHYLVVHINIHRAIYILFRQEILSAQIGVCKLIKTYGSLIWAIYD